jgi:arginase family enzyme
VVRRSDVVRHSGSGSVPVVLGGDNEVKHPESQ